MRAADRAQRVVRSTAFSAPSSSAHSARLIARDRLIDTMALARRKHSAGPYSLDALCVRYGIDNSRRTKHGALLDAEILAEVYLELIGARQASLSLVEDMAISLGSARPRRGAAADPAGAAPDRRGSAAHREFVATLGEESMWRHYAGLIPLWQE